MPGRLVDRHTTATHPNDPPRPPRPRPGRLTIIGQQGRAGHCLSFPPSPQSSACQARSVTPLIGQYERIPRPTRHPQAVSE
jgi:hypothetical protein